MPKASTSDVEKQRMEVELLVRGHSEGIDRASLEGEYEQRYGHRIPSRTLQRRLEELVASGRVVPAGESTARRYHPPPQAPPSIGTPDHLIPHLDDAEPGRPGPVPPAKPYVPLSPEGKEVLRLVRRPAMQRKPIGYDRKFIARYDPGSTWYLPETMRLRLHQIGRTPDPDRPAGTFARDILHRLLIDLSWASSRLEGNTYDRLDTKNLLEFGQRAEGKDAAETQMILNHKSAIEFLVENAGTVAFNSRTLLTLHALLSENLLADPEDEGRLRERPVGITGTTYIPVAIPQVIHECFEMFLAKAERIPDPFERAFFAMVHIPYLQPFADVNKRTSRLAANIPLLKSNLSPLSFVDVPEQSYTDGNIGVYELARIELLRDVFAWSYERSCEQYRVVRDSVEPPDPIRLKYRHELADLVRETVIEARAPRRAALRERGAAVGVAGADLDAFAERALTLLMSLHEGNAWRYRLRPSEFDVWRAKFSPESREG